MNKSDLISFVLEHINRNFNYLIIRNYEGLPFEEGHDIDFLIKKDDVGKIADLLAQLESEFGVDIHKNYRYYGLFSHIIVMDQHILHLDFFTQIGWNRIAIIDTAGVLERRVFYNNLFWVLSNEDFCKHCWLLFVLRKGNLHKKKYLHAAYDYQKSKNIKIFDIDIKLDTYRKNYNKLVFFYFKNQPKRFLKKSIKNLAFKISKFACPKGRIFLDTDLGRSGKYAIDFCFIKSIDFVTPHRNRLLWLKIYVELVAEHAVVVSRSVVELNPEIKWFLGPHFRGTSPKLKDTVREMVR